MRDIFPRYYAFWRALGHDHWEALKCALDDMHCEGLTAPQAYR